MATPTDVGFVEMRLAKGRGTINPQRAPRAAAATPRHGTIPS
jgi:hypothetical protein